MAFEAGGGKSTKVLRFMSGAVSDKMIKMGFKPGMTDAEILALKKKISAKESRRKVLKK